MKKIFFLLTILLVFFIKSGFSQAPNWTVNPSSFQYSMTITAVLNMNYTESTDGTDMVGAFIGGQCRGVASPIYISSVNRWIVYLIVYSNSSSGTINFQMYDNSSNTILSVTKTVLFSVNGLIGTTVAPYVISNPELSNESFLLTYSVPGEISPATFSGFNVSFYMPYGTDFTNLVANYTASPNALVTVNGVVQSSGVTSNNFTNTLNYVVRSADETTTNTYTVTGEVINSSPTDITVSCDSVSEIKKIGTVIGGFNSADLEPGIFTYSLVPGIGSTDNAKFTIVADSLKTNFIFDYETQNLFSIRVKTLDNEGGFFEKQFNIKIIDFNEDISFSCDSISELKRFGTSVGKILYSDTTNAPYTFSFITGVGDTDNSKFIITGDSIFTNTRFDFETKNLYSVRIKSLDSYGRIYSEPVSIKILDYFEDITISDDTINEFAVPNTFIGQLFYSDTVNIPHIFSLVTGAGSTDNNFFKIINDSLFTKILVDFEYKEFYSIRIKTLDAYGRIYEDTLKIQVINKQEVISLIPNVLNEIYKVGSGIGKLFSTDDISPPDNSFSLVAGAGDTDNNSFYVDNDTLRNAVRFDFETQNFYSIRIKYTSSTGIEFENVLSVAILDYFEDISLSCDSINEIFIAGTEIGEFSYSDTVNTNFTYSLVSGTGDTDNSAFQIVGDTLKSAIRFDFETQNQYSIRVKVDDNVGATFEEIFIIRILDYFEDISLSCDSINEIFIAGTEIGEFSYSDTVNANLTYSLVSGTGDTDNSAFQIVGDTLKSAIRFDFETQNQYSIRVKVDDNVGATFEEIFIIRILDYFEDISLSCDSINEIFIAGTEIGQFSYSDTINANFTYSLVSGPGDVGNSAFQIIGDTLKSEIRFDFETQNQYSIRLKVDDNVGATFEEIFIIRILNYFEDLYISNDSISENTNLRSLVTLFSTTDTINNFFTYTLVSGIGDVDNSSFEIVGDTLKNIIDFDYETQTEFSIRAEISDNFGWYFQKDFTIYVTDENDEFPVSDTYTEENIDENITNQVIYTIISTDNDSTPDYKIHRYFQIDTLTDANFSLDSISGEITILNPLDYENQSEFPLNIYITDGINQIAIEILILLNDLNDEVPQIEDSVFIEVSDNTELETELFVFEATDRDEATILTFTISNDFDEIFTLSEDGILTLNKYLNYDIQNQYNFTVTVSDGSNEAVTNVELNVIYTEKINFYAYKIISPNSDNHLDTWEIENTIIYRDCKFQIFNTSGEIIFEQTGYDIPWDGTFNGKELPIGAYYYIITTPRGEYVKGNITLIK